jgi:hypothetical protein
MQTIFQNYKVSVNIKLALLWTTFMFLYTYVDHFTLYMPGIIQGITQGKVYLFNISQGFIFTALALSTIPMFMIFLSVVLPSKVNRIVNIVIASIHVPYMLFNLSGEAWLHMYFAAALEMILLGLIIAYAWKWPRVEE